MVYIHTAFFICPSASTKNRPGFLSRKPGRSFVLFVIFQALTQLLAGVLDRSLSGCQNYRAFGFTVVRCLHFKQAIKHMILNLAADVVRQAAAHKPNT